MLHLMINSVLSIFTIVYLSVAVCHFYRAMHFSANARYWDRMSSVRLSVCEKKEKKGKDVDLYSAFHAPGTPNAHVTETRPPDRHLGHRPACNTQPVQ